MSLRTYRAKRNLKVSPEPTGKKQARAHPSRKTKTSKAAEARAQGRTRRTAARPRKFVVQEHFARTHHFDFRLEYNGTLRSWAVPKGPSMNPRDRRLAIEVEDHPLDYAKFEGEIPKGHYGAGKVSIWDGGTWEPVAGQAVREMLESGRLSFVLHGRKLKGRWSLVRTRKDPRSGKAQWLLLKQREPRAET